MQSRRSFHTAHSRDPQCPTGSQRFPHSHRCHGQDISGHTCRGQEEGRGGGGGEGRRGREGRGGGGEEEGRRRRRGGGGGGEEEEEGRRREVSRGGVGVGGGGGGWAEEIKLRKYTSHKHYYIYNV